MAAHDTRCPGRIRIHFGHPPRGAAPRSAPHSVLFRARRLAALGRVPRLAPLLLLRLPRRTGLSRAGALHPRPRPRPHRTPPPPPPPLPLLLLRRRQAPLGQAKDLDLLALFPLFWRLLLLGLLLGRLPPGHARVRRVTGRAASARARARARAVGAVRRSGGIQDTAPGGRAPCARHAPPPSRPFSWTAISSPAAAAPPPPPATPAPRFREHSLQGAPPHPTPASLPYKVDTSRPSLRTNWTRPLRRRDAPWLAVLRAGATNRSSSACSSALLILAGHGGSDWISCT